MSYNGSGTFNINTAGQPVVTGTVISSTAFNALTADLGTGLSTAITKDGQTVATARIPFAQGINSSLVTDATNTTTGSIITAGGVGIAKALFVGTTANIAGTTTLAGVTATSITDSGLTSGRVTYAGTAGLLQDSANLTFNGTTLTANTIGAFTLSGTVAGGGNQLNNVVIGTTTPLAGAFTTLTASTSAIIGSGNAAAKIIADGANNFQIINNALTPNSGNFALEQNLNGSTFLNSASGQTLNLGVNSSVIAAITSTGLAVTGTLSATGTISNTGTSLSGSAAAGSLVLDASGNLLVGLSSGTTNQIDKNIENDYVLNVRNTASANNYGITSRYPNSSPNGAGNQFFICSDSTANRIILYSNGGIANYAANNVILSDRREKINFQPAKSYLDVICSIPVQTFNYIDQNRETDDGLTLGVVAQDVQSVAPEFVTETNWGTEEEPKMRLSIYQTDLQYALMKCIQEQQAIITALTTRITALEAK